MRRIGHLGTLDPMATGVLPLIVGRATRLAQFFQRNDKKYDGLIRLGVTSDTYDRDGTVTQTDHGIMPTRDELEQTLDAYRGSFLQTPPPISAKKVKGVPAYKLARKNVPLELEPVEVTVYSLEILEFGGNTVSVRVHCTGGTYVRSIAHDLGQRLGCGGILESLRRTASGDFTDEHSHTMEQLETMSREERLQEAVIPAAQLLPEIPSERVDHLTASQIRQGRDFRVSPFRVRKDSRLVKAVDTDGQLVAIGEARLPNVYHPVLVL